MTKDEIIATAKENADRIIESYRKDIELADRRGDSERLGGLYRQMQRDITMANAPFVRMLALLPPEPIVIPKDKMQ
jgi:hypothetical protein